MIPPPDVLRRGFVAATCTRTPGAAQKTDGRDEESSSPHHQVCTKFPVSTWCDLLWSTLNDRMSRGSPAGASVCCQCIGPRLPGCDPLAPSRGPSASHLWSPRVRLVVPSLPDRIPPLARGPSTDHGPGAPRCHGMGPLRPDWSPRRTSRQSRPARGRSPAAGAGALHAGRWSRAHAASREPGGRCQEPGAFFLSRDTCGCRLYKIWPD